MTEKTARDKIGLYIKKYDIPSQISFRVRTGLHSSYGYLTLKRISTSIIVGKVTENNLETTHFGLNPSELATLKQLLKDFDSRLLTWKTTKDLNKEVKIS